MADEKKYIEQGAALDAVFGQFCASSDETERALNAAIEEIRAIPAADVAPVVRGKWIKRVYYRKSTQAYDCEMYVCSECGSEWSYDAETGSSDFNYCPNCGADMREES